MNPDTLNRSDSVVHGHHLPNPHPHASPAPVDPSRSSAVGADAALWSAVVAEPVAEIVRVGVGVLAGVVACGSACYLAPIEFAAGRWLGLPPWQAWTITAAVEGLTLAALLAGRLAGGLLPTALALTWVSAAVGTLHSADEQARRSGHALDGQATVSALLVCALMVLAPALMHRLRVRVHREHGAVLAAAQARAESAAREQAERGAVERAAARAAAERDAAASRDHELAIQRARAFAEQEQTRLQLEHARIEHARAETEHQTEQARAQAEREHAIAEQARAAAERDRAQAEQTRAALERDHAAAEQDAAREHAEASAARAALRTDRDLARAHWARREADGRPMPVAEVADLLAVSQGRARAIIADWRRRTHLPDHDEPGPDIGPDLTPDTAPGTAS